MSHTYSSQKFTTPKQLLRYTDALTKLQVNSTLVRMEFQMKKELDLHQQNFYNVSNRSKEIQSSQTSSSQSQSSSEEQPFEQPSDASSTTTAPAPDQLKKLGKSSYIFFIPPELKFVFWKVYDKKIRDVEVTFGCQITKTSQGDDCKITGESIEKRELLPKLKGMINNLLVERIPYVAKKAVWHSKIVAQKLSKYSIHIGKDQLYAKKQDISEDNFKKHIKQLKSSVMVVVKLWDDDSKRSPNRKHTFSRTIFNLIIKSLEPSIRKMEQLYELDIELITSIKSYIIHSSSLQLAEEIKSQILNKVSTLLCFGLVHTLSLDHETEVNNFMKRYVPSKVHTIITRRTIFFSMPLSMYSKHSQKIEALLKKPYFNFNPNSQIVLVGNHSKLTSEEVKQLFELPTLSKFRDSKIIGKNIHVREPKQTMSCLHNCLTLIDIFKKKLNGEKIVVSDLIFQPEPDAKQDIPQKKEQDSRSETSEDEQDKHPEEVTEQHPIEEQQTIYPFNLLEQKMEPGIFFIEDKKDNKLEEYISQRFMLPVRCRRLKFNQNIVRNIEHAQLFFTAEQFMDGGKLRQGITLHKLSQLQHTEAKYFVQVEQGQYCKNPPPKEGFVVKGANYVPTHNVLKC